MMPSVETWVKFFFTKGFPFCSWAEHVEGFWRLRDRANVLFLTYEEMKQDLAGTVRRIAAFLEIELSPEELEAVVEQASFPHMKQIEHKFGSGMFTPWSRVEGTMIRRGERAASGELLTPAQQQRIDDHCRAELERLDCDFPYATRYDNGMGSRHVSRAASSAK
jgi:hypothetical protein